MAVALVWQCTDRHLTVMCGRVIQSSGPIRTQALIKANARGDIAQHVHYDGVGSDGSDAKVSRGRHRVMLFEFGPETSSRLKFVVRSLTVRTICSNKP